MVRPASAAASSTTSVGEVRETFIRSLIGPQADSRKESAPSYGFGTGDRSGALVAPAGGKRAVGLSPGPVYLVSPRNPGLGRTGPAFSMSGTPANPGGRRAGAAPGPGEYEKPPSCGMDQTLSYKSTSPRFGWGTGGRHQAPIGSRPRSACNEFYEVSSSMGAQPLGTKATKPNYTFSGASRYDDPQKARNKAAAPGPGAYKYVGGSGVQVDSTFRSKPIYGFSRAARFKGGGLDGTGPELNSGTVRPAIGPQVVSTMRSKPASSFGSAKRFADRPNSARDGPGPGSYNA
jgi:hypothetical protein